MVVLSNRDSRAGVHLCSPSVMFCFSRERAPTSARCFGGSSQTVFGSSGAGNFLTKLTGALAVLFFATSMILAYGSTKHVTSSIFDRYPANKAVPAKPAPSEKSAAPAVPAPAAPAKK